MDAMAAIKQTFFQECEEQLGELEIGLLVLQDGDTDPETVNAVFRAVHSIKGGAGALNLDELVHFAHVFENVLDHLRAGRLAASGDVLKTMLRAADIRGGATRSPPNSAPSIPRRQARISTVAINTATAMTWKARYSRLCQSVSMTWKLNLRQTNTNSSSTSRLNPTFTPRPTRPRF
jgi:chemotaxis protein histidine kinase CheA